ncbi:hypothetical protein M2271_006360 [Streptomyces sp. LBL]|nr:hypothetical protein [Streptomyces sp. LBL]
MTSSAVDGLSVWRLLLKRPPTAGELIADDLPHAPASTRELVIAGVHEQFPGFVFRPVGPVDGHHDTAQRRSSAPGVEVTPCR